MRAISADLPPEVRYIVTSDKLIFNKNLSRAERCQDFKAILSATQIPHENKQKKTS